MVSEDYARQLHVVIKLHTLFSFLHRLHFCGAWYCSSTLRYIAIVFCNERLCLLLVDVACYYHNGIVRHIEGFVKLHEFIQRSLVYVLLLTYGAPAVWISSVCVFKNHVDELPVWGVVITLPFFFFH